MTKRLQKAFSQCFQKFPFCRFACAQGALVPKECLKAPTGPWQEQPLCPSRPGPRSSTRAAAVTVTGRDSRTAPKAPKAAGIDREATVKRGEMEVTGGGRSARRAPLGRPLAATRTLSRGSRPGSADTGVGSEK